MNFKTTIVLIVTLAVVGAVMFFTRDKGNTPTPAPAEAKLIDVPAGDVTKIVIRPADQKPIALEKSGPNKWKLTSPVNAPADASAAETLAQAVTSLTSSGEIDPGGENAAVTGLAQPAYRIEVTSKDGKTSKLAVGNRSATGGNLYVQRD